MAQDMPYLHIQEMSAIRFSLSSENFHIFNQGVRKTLSICLQSNGLRYKFSNLFLIEQKYRWLKVVKGY